MYRIIVRKELLKNKERNVLKNASLEYVFNKNVPDDTDILDDDFDHWGIQTQDAESIAQLRELFPDARQLSETEYNDMKSAAENGEDINPTFKQYQRMSVVGEPEGRRFRGTTILEETIPGKTSGDFEETSFDYVMPENREIDGVRFKAYGADWRNKVSFEIVNPVDQSVLDEFVIDWHIDEPSIIRLYRAKILKDLIVRMKVKNYSDQPFDIWVDAFLHEYPA